MASNRYASVASATSLADRRPDNSGDPYGTYGTGSHDLIGAHDTGELPLSYHQDSHAAYGGYGSHGTFGEYGSYDPSLAYDPGTTAEFAGVPGDGHDTGWFGATPDAPTGTAAAHDGAAFVDHTFDAPAPAPVE
ncbi:hypothetical protein E1283_35950, partial [Streptomyces hainanensis]